MTKMDEAVREAVIQTRYQRPGENVERAFHRALRERGYVVVPVEPNAEMMADAREAAGVGVSWNRALADAYRAMIGAVK